MAAQARSRSRTALILIGIFLLAGVLGTILDPPDKRSFLVAQPAKIEPRPTSLPEPSAQTKRDLRAVAGENIGPVKVGDLDEADKAIRLTINLAGHLCAKPILVQSAGSGHYGVTCILYRSGKGRANYLVQLSTGKVTAL